ncbi:Endocytosis protein end4 [Grifola frondosa]|uniref:Endocytosis protein end4 n=1 Tax=Grifola frondosa TaxID=5627 RepID=A0A1C7LUY0_GRIFR|nr:Endocytosis protein end4 [Grifola frondosa]
MYSGQRTRQTAYDIDGDEVHYPTRPVDKDKAEAELVVNIKKATNPDETAPKQKHVRKCIVYTWDYHSSISFWTGLRVQPILADEVQTFKALITVHKVLQEGHPVTIKEAHGQTGWLETCARTVGHETARGYGPLIRTYVQFILAKLRFHRLRPEFNGLFEYEEYVTLKGIDDPNEGYETISDLMGLQDQIDSFQRMIFAHFRHSASNECRISALVPLVKESTNDTEALEPLRQRFSAQHYALRKFYYECSNLKYLTGLINVPKLGQYEEQQAALLAAREEEERRRKELEEQQRREFEQRQAEQAERERLAQEQLVQQQMQQQMMQYSNQAAQQMHDLERELLAMRMLSKDELIKQLQDQVTLWRNKYEALAKLYSQLRTEHLDMLSKFKQMQLKANSAQEAVDRCIIYQAKQLQIDDLLVKLDGASGDMERLREEKDQEIAILQEGMDSTIQQLSDAQQNQGLTEEATNTQIDTLILDNRKKLNQIIDSILNACVQKIDESIYELESPAQAGNLNSTPEYTLSMIEKAINNATDFATVFNLYLGGEVGGEHVDVIKGANELAQALSDVLINTKGITRLVNDDASDKLIEVAKNAGDVGMRVFLNLQSYKLDLKPPSQRKEVAMRNNGEVRGALTKLSEVVDSIVPKGGKAGALAKTNGDIGDLVEQEMLGAAKAIEAATERLQQLMSRPRDSTRFSAVDLQVHDSILAAAMAITNAIARLIRAATESQQEIVAQGKGSSTTQQFYKRNNRWTEGLISAARSVAFATNLLIESADVAAATAQLVAASRVKANLMSKTQERLELAAKAVTEACKALVKQVKAISAKQVQEEEVDYQNMATLEFKKREMEQQVEILRLEKDLGAARHRLGAMRRAGYHTDETD